MPMMINKHGRAVCVLEDRVADSLRRGLRMVTAEDMAFAETQAPVFALPYINGWEKGALGERLVSVHGAGPSMNARVGGAYSIGVNAREGCTPPDAVVALDEIYWHERLPTWMQGIPLFHPNNVNNSAPNRHPFAMPLSIYNYGESNNNRIEALIHGAITNCHFSGIAAVLVAKYLSAGPTVLTGFELSGSDASGHDYRARQQKAWEAMSKVLPDVFLHPEMTGPLCDMFPKWEAPAFRASGSLAVGDADIICKELGWRSKREAGAMDAV